eukprot:11988089-Heterocapsa_arctica.AAC.1
MKKAREGLHYKDDEGITSKIYAKRDRTFEERALFRCTGELWRMCEEALKKSGKWTDELGMGYHGAEGPGVCQGRPQYLDALHDNDGRQQRKDRSAHGEFVHVGHRGRYRGRVDGGGQGEGWPRRT